MRLKQQVGDTSQPSSGHHISNEMECVTCDLWDVRMRGGWEEPLPFSTESFFFLGGHPAAVPECAVVPGAF